MKKNLQARSVSLILILIMLFSVFTACGDVDVEINNDGNVNVGVNTGGRSETYTVTFLDWDGSVIDVQSEIVSGSSAAAPSDPTREGWIFLGWDKAFGSVSADMTVTALYRFDDSCKHSLTAISAVSPDCTNAGNCAYWYCEKCKSCFSDENAENEIKKSDTLISALGHTVVIDEAVASTYETTGLTEGSHCSACNTVLSAQVSIPALKSSHHSIIYKNLKSATVPVEYSQYSENAGFDLPEDITVDGYRFDGWYTKPEGGEKVIYIPKGSTEDYVLYAHWSLVTYSITYIDAPKNSNVTTYTIEDEVRLTDPEWSGLSFVNWTNSNGDTVNRITKGTTGNIDLTANWKSVMNTAIPKNGDRQLMVEFDSKNGMYYFIYELGTLQNVVLDDMKANSENTSFDLYNKTNDADRTLKILQSISINESRASGISNTISNSVTSSKDWSETNTTASSSSNTHHWSVSAEIKIGKDSWPVSGKIGASGGYNWTEETSTSKATTTSTSESSGSEESREISSTLEYATTLGKEKEVSVDISGDMPNGFYAYIHAGNVKVYAVAAYDIENRICEFSTYSILDNTYELLLYARDAEELNSTKCESLNYKIPIDVIGDMVDSAYYVKYELMTQDASNTVPSEIVNPNSNAIIYDENGEKPIFASPTRSEYDKFLGWYADSEFNTLVDDAWIEAWCNNEERGNITLYAKWDLAVYYNTLEGTPKLAPIGNRSTFVIDWSNYLGTYDYASKVGMNNERFDETGSIDISIYQYVTDVYFIGNENAYFTNVYIVPTNISNGQDLNLHFENFRFEGAIFGEEADACNLILNFEGSNEIVGVTGGYTTVRDLKNVTVTGDGNLTIKGANGADSTTAGEAGADGKAAIEVDDLTIDMSGTLIISGGDGSDGYEGKTGGHTYNAGDGGNGGNGGNGGKGGHPAVLSNDYDPDQMSDGGDGGNGGNGYVAGNGGNGGQGGGSYGTDRITTLSGTLWGTSGNGGDGGDGGDKIYGVLYVNGVAECLITTEECGTLGAFGSCGPVLDEGEGEHGKYGYNGSNGTSGSVDNSYFLEFEGLFE